MTFTARYAGKCADCGELFPAGTPLQRHHVTGEYSHEVCEPPEQPRREVCRAGGGGPGLMITFGTQVRHDGQAVRWRRNSEASDPDEALRFEAFPARCGCYPHNTDWREWVCSHGAIWTRGAFEPYGKPREPYWDARTGRWEPPRDE